MKNFILKSLLLLLSLPAWSGYSLQQSQAGQTPGGNPILVEQIHFDRSPVLIVAVTLQEADVRLVALPISVDYSSRTLVVKLETFRDAYSKGQTEARSSFSVDRRRNPGRWTVVFVNQDNFVVGRIELNTL